MPTVSSKRQVTLPASQCDALGIKPGDQVEFFSTDNELTIVKKQSGAAKGMLSHIKIDDSVSDEQSLQGNFE